MPRSLTKQQVVSEFRRNEILNAARTVFARRGFAAGILDEVAREAGIAKGTIYLYFDSKTEIYRAVLDGDMEALKEDTLRRMEAAPTLRGKITAFVRSRLENAETRSEFFRIMDADPSASISRKQYRDWLREPVLALAMAFEAAAARGEVRPLPAEKLAWMLADLARGSIQRQLLGHSDRSAAEEAEFISDFFWTSIAAK